MCGFANSHRGLEFVHFHKNSVHLSLSQKIKIKISRRRSLPRSLQQAKKLAPKIVYFWNFVTFHGVEPKIRLRKSHFELNVLSCKIFHNQNHLLQALSDHNAQIQQTNSRAKFKAKKKPRLCAY